MDIAEIGGRFRNKYGFLSLVFDQTLCEACCCHDYVFRNGINILTYVRIDLIYMASYKQYTQIYMTDWG